jgi:hypothetical protein
VGRQDEAAPPLVPTGSRRSGVSAADAASVPDADAARSVAVVSAPAAVGVALAPAASRVAVVSGPDAEDVAAVTHGVDAGSDPVAQDALATACGCASSMSAPPAAVGPWPNTAVPPPARGAHPPVPRRPPVMSRSTSLGGSALTREPMVGRLPGTSAAAGIGTDTPDGGIGQQGGGKSSFIEGNLLVYFPRIVVIP